MKNKLIWILGFVLIVLISLMWLADNAVNNSTNGYIFRNTKDIPYNKVGLLLGTSKYLKSGRPNYYFINRIKATVALYKARKIDFIVISGDNSKEDYNEPLDMKIALIKAGVPANKIFLDYAGFRTFDSVIRMNKIFSQKSFTIISQEFHNRRAVFIAKKLKLKAYGYTAKDIDAYSGFKTKVREKFARLKMFIDLATSKKPKFLGKKIEIK